MVAEEKKLGFVLTKFFSHFFDNGFDKEWVVVEVSQNFYGRNIPLFLN